MSRDCGVSLFHSSAKEQRVAVAGHSSVGPESSCTERVPLINETHFLKAGYSDLKREGPSCLEQPQDGDL